MAYLIVERIFVGYQALPRQRKKKMGRVVFFLMPSVHFKDRQGLSAGANSPTKNLVNAIQS